LRDAGASGRWRTASGRGTVTTASRNPESAKPKPKRSRPRSENSSKSPPRRGRPHRKNASCPRATTSGVLGSAVLTQTMATSSARPQPPPTLSPGSGKQLGATPKSHRASRHACLRRQSPAGPDPRRRATTTRRSPMPTSDLPLLADLAGTSAVTSPTKQGWTCSLIVLGFSDGRRRLQKQQPARRC
jgi:hypothetical protein